MSYGIKIINTDSTIVLDSEHRALRLHAFFSGTLYARTSTVYTHYFSSLSYPPCVFVSMNKIKNPQVGSYAEIWAGCWRLIKSGSNYVGVEIANTRTFRQAITWSNPESDINVPYYIFVLRYL